MTKKKSISIDTLVQMMKKGFDETTAAASNTDKNVNNIIGLIKLTRLEMAKDEDLQEIKKTVNSLYEMLDDEARFIEQMRTEYPLFIKRLERLEKKLGLPHHLSEI